MLFSGLLSWLKSRSRSPYRAPHPARRRRSSPLSECLARDWLLEDRCVPSADPLMPITNVSKLSDIFWNGGDSTARAISLGIAANIPEAPSSAGKTVTITNSSDQTIYPIFRDANNGQLGGKFYDPEDGLNQEFRAYIGHHDPTKPVGQQDLLGLRKGETITITLPLVFWDAANIYFASDGSTLLNTGDVNNPFGYVSTADRFKVGET